MSPSIFNSQLTLLQQYVAIQFPIKWKWSELHCQVILAGRLFMKEIIT